MPAALAQNPGLLPRIEESVAKLRGLPKLSEVPLQFVDSAQLREKLLSDLESSYSAEDRETDQKLMVLLGLIRPDQSYLDLSVDLLQEQVVGLYDQDLKVMFVIGDQPQFGVNEEITFAHEFVHALQDQHFNLNALIPRELDNYDRVTALHALVEGDAVLNHSLWAQQTFSNRELQSLDGQDRDTSAMDQSPLVIRTELLFPYTDGLQFAIAAYQRARGPSGLDEAYRRPPESTEQIIHPDKYRTGEAPIPVELPDLAARLGDGWRLVGSNVLGEMYLRILVEQNSDTATGSRAAAGWGGDRWQVLEKDGRPSLVLKTTWDTPAEAREFFDTYTAGLRKRFPTATTDFADPSRQALRDPATATDVRISGSDVTILIAPDRPTADTIHGAL